MSAFFRRSQALACAAVLLLSSPAFACDPPSLGAGQKLVDSEHYRVAWRVRPDPIAVSEPFALEISVCAKSAAQPAEGIAVDAVMPEHRHGMNYRPSVARIESAAGARYRSEGWMFHMPGRWEIVFEVDGERLADSVSIE